MVDKIPIKNFLTPVLHAVDFMSNKTLNGIFVCYHARIEDCPESVLEARRLYWDAELQKDEVFLDLQRGNQILGGSQTTTPRLPGGEDAS